MCFAAAPVGSESLLVSPSEYLLTTQNLHAGVFLYLRGWLLEAPIQKLPEDTFTTVRGGGVKKRLGTGVVGVRHQSPKVYVPL